LAACFFFDSEIDVMNSYGLKYAVLLGLLVSLVHVTVGQTRGSMTLYGDVKVDEKYAEQNRLGTLTIILYANGGATIVGRTTVPVNGRYRFNNLPSGEYDLAVEADMTEIARVHISVAGRPGSDSQHDLELAWKPVGLGVKPRPSTISADELYQRSAGNQSLFVKAQSALDAKKYADAVSFLSQIVERDEQDFQGWTELGTAFLLSGKKSEAEDAYERALKARPNFKLALLNLGRLRVEQKKYEEAVVPLTTLVQIDPRSPDGNLALGEAYIHLKKGSKAVGYLNEAAKLGRPDAHLWLATLYDAAKVKDRAAAEYVQFLQKRPNHPDRKKLEKYIAENGKN
jgi:Flp pilus assembly protein TadD